ncbi:MAG TPA: hypothetical protein VLN45_09430 [Ignavibacteriaceae bacterium]|nr:hypothetical protein [Ignavibacteriaceae bacterium]
MKKLFVMALFILSLTFISCSDKEKNETNLNKDKAETDSKSVSEGNKSTQKQNLETATRIERADASYETKVEEGTIIPILIENDQKAFEFSGNKILAITLADGKLYQIEKDGDKTIIDIPGKGKMQAIKMDDKVYLFDNDNKAYEVKFEDNKLYAERSDMTKILLSKK